VTAQPPARDFAGDAERHFAGDAERHRLDAPRHCPRCGAALTAAAGIAVEFWEGDDRVFHTWCATCRWTGNIVPTTQMSAFEPG